MKQVRAGRLERLERSPLLLWWGVSLLVAVFTAIIWPTIPSYDPFSWVVWGREVTDPHISFFIGGGPSWKPLPFLFTTVYGPFGAAAPGLWVVTARTGGVAGLIGAFRLAAMLTRRVGLTTAACYAAGLVAAIGIVLTAPSSGWTYYFFRGASEPLLVGVAIWAVDRFIAGRIWTAYWLLAAEGLMRPEAWPFLFLLGAWLFWREGGRARIWVVLGLVLQPVGWFVPPWISTGDPFLAATHASEYNGHLGTDVLKTVLSRGEGLQSLPSLAFAVVAVVLAAWFGRASFGAFSVWVRRRQFRTAPPELPLEIWIAVGIVAWWVVVVGMTLDGYPGLERFFLPAAALTCVLSGVGLVRLAWLIGEWLGGLVSGGGGARGRLAIAGVATVVFLGASVHYLTTRVDYARAQEPLAATAVTRIGQLGDAIAALGGRGKVLPCGSSVVTINHSLQTAMAWKLQTTLERVKTYMDVPGLAFVGPHDSIDGGDPPISPTLSVHTLIKTVGAWEIFEVYAPGAKPPCVGS